MSGSMYDCGLLPPGAFLFQTAAVQTGSTTSAPRAREVDDTASSLTDSSTTTPEHVASGTGAGAGSYDVPAHTPGVALGADAGSEAAHPLAMLNSASYGNTPASVHRAHVALLARIERFPDAWYRREALPAYLRVAAEVARSPLVRASPDDIVLLENTTSAVNAVLASLPPSQRGLYVITNHTYNACRLAVEHYAKRNGARVVKVDLPLDVEDEAALVRDFEASLHASLAEFADEHLEFVLLDHITSPTSIVMPYRRLTQVCHALGARVMVDGAHAPGQVPIPLAVGSKPSDFPTFTPREGADDTATTADQVPEWYAGNLHKWAFTPKGVAFLFARADVQRDTQGVIISHYALHPQWQYRFFMQATNDQSRQQAVPAAFKFVEEECRGWTAVATYNVLLADEAQALLARAWKSETILSARLATPYMRCVATPLDYRYFTHAVKTAGTPVAELPAPDQGVEANATAVADGGVNENVANAVLKAANIQSQFFTWLHNGRLYVFCRLSAQIYNFLSEYARLAEAVTRLASDMHGL